MLSLKDILKDSCVIAIAFIAGILVVVSLYCSNDNNTQYSVIKKDTIYVDKYIEIPLIIGSGTATKDKVYSKIISKNDTTLNYELSNQVLHLLSQRDSLTALLAEEKVSIPVTLCETIQSTKDSICIKYDEITRSLSYSVQLAPRKIEVPIITETIIEEPSIWEKIGYGVFGAAVAIVALEVL